MPFSNQQKAREYTREHSRARRKAHPGLGRVSKRQWRLDHPELVKAMKRRYYLKYRERLLIKQKTYYNNNADKCLLSMKAYALEHPNEILRNRRKWAHKNTLALTAKEYRRRAKLAGCKSDSTAETFYAFVRSKKRIRCYYCGSWVSGKKAHVDHVIAVNKQGNHASDNLSASCPKCNCSKNDKLPSETAFNSQPLLNL